MKNPFRTLTVSDVINKQLVDARLEFLQAVANAEAWASQAAMLHQRTQRLEGYLKPPVPAQPPLPTLEPQ